MHRISIIIPTYNRKQYLEKILHNLFAQIYVAMLQVDIYVVVDGSNDGTFEMLRSTFPMVNIIEGTGNWWFTKSLNEGIKKALETKTDFILVLNDDCEIDNLYVSNIYKACIDNGSNCLMGSITIGKGINDIVRFSGVKKIIRWRLKTVLYLPNNYKLNSFEKLTGVYPSKTLIGRGLLIPVDVFAEIGFFEEKFIQYGSDEEFTFRAIKKGYEAYICWDAKCFDNEKLTAKGTVYNNPSLCEFFASFFNPYTRNNIIKDLRFYWRVGYPVLLPLYFVILIVGSFKAYFSYRQILPKE